MEDYFKVLPEVLKLGKLQIQMLIIELLEKDKIGFAELSTMYVEKLRKERQELQEEIMPLALWISLAAEGNVKRDDIRDFINKKGYFKGSKYGDQLANELEKLK